MRAITSGIAKAVVVEERAESRVVSLKYCVSIFLSRERTIAPYFFPAMKVSLQGTS